MRFEAFRLQVRGVLTNYVSYFLTKTYIVDAQKNHLNETGSYEHPKHMFGMIDKIKITILHLKIAYICAYEFMIKTMTRDFLLQNFPKYVKDSCVIMTAVNPFFLRRSKN